jgi:hypothetical protein
MFNTDLDLQSFVLADPPPKKQWYRVADTGLPSPNDILTSGEEECLESQKTYTVKARSIVVLMSKEKL